MPNDSRPPTPASASAPRRFDGCTTAARCSVVHYRQQLNTSEGAPRRLRWAPPPRRRNTRRFQATPVQGHARTDQTVSLSLAEKPRLNRPKGLFKRGFFVSRERKR